MLSTLQGAGEKLLQTLADSCRFCCSKLRDIKCSRRGWWLPGAAIHPHNCQGYPNREIATSQRFCETQQFCKDMAPSISLQAENHAAVRVFEKPQEVWQILQLLPLQESVMAICASYDLTGSHSELTSTGCGRFAPNCLARRERL